MKFNENHWESLKSNEIHWKVKDNQWTFIENQLKSMKIKEHLWTSMNINNRPPTLSAGAAVPRRMASSIWIYFTWFELLFTYVEQNVKLTEIILKINKCLRILNHSLPKIRKMLIWFVIEDAMRRGTAAPAFRVGGLLFIKMSFS